jgi:nicotinamide mononucleotide transporter
MLIYTWISNNYIELFGAVTGILYVFLEIRQTIWLWPVGIITSAVYIWVFFASKFYADMSLQVYYLVISCLGWYWWAKGAGHRAQGKEQRAQSTEHMVEEGTGEGENERLGDVTKRSLQVTRLTLKTGIVLSIIFIILYAIMWLVLTRLTDSPVPVRDSFITSLSIIATWMLARKIYEHWFLWIVVNSTAAVLFLTRGLYPTVILYVVYGIMSFAGLIEWKKSINKSLTGIEK